MYEKYLNKIKVKMNLKISSMKEILINFLSFTCAKANDIGHLETE